MKFEYIAHCLIWNSGKHGLLFALVASTLVGCGTLSLDPTLPEKPLFRTIDARVGIAYYGPARHALVLNPMFRIEVGKSSITRFDQVFTSMFAKTVALPDWPPWRDELFANVDGVIELQSTEARFTLGDGQNIPDSVTISYKLCLYEARGLLIQCFNPSAQHTYQRQMRDYIWDLGRYSLDLVQMTVREAIARFMLEFESDPLIRKWESQLLHEAGSE